MQNTNYQNHPLILDVTRKCKLYGFKYKFYKSKKHHEGVAGMVSVEDKILISCLKRKDWLSILVHESCHLDQFINNEFNDVFTTSFNIWDPNQKNINPKQYLKEFKRLTDCEIDCDIKAISKISKLKLDVDIKEYIASSNCYHACYYYFYKHLIFYHPNHCPYNLPELNNEFPNNRILSLSEIWKDNVSHKLENHILKYNTPM